MNEENLIELLSEIKSDLKILKSNSISKFRFKKLEWAVYGVLSVSSTLFVALLSTGNVKVVFGG